MMFRNTTIPCFLLATMSIFLLAHDSFVVMAQAPFLTIPTDANIRASLDLTTNPNLPTLSNSIVHGALGSSYKIEINYYAANCQGTPLVKPTTPPLDVAVATLNEGNGVYSSTITNTLADLKAITGATFFDLVGAGAEYKYCIEFLLKTVITNSIVDQERYGVTLAAAVDGSVATGTTVITDIDTDPDATTFTAKVIVCDPATGALDTSNFFEGDSITLCFTSTNYPEASITDINTLTLTPSSGTPIDITLGVTGVTSNYDITCADADGVQSCRYTVLLDFPSLFAAGTTADSDRTVAVDGELDMRFGFVRRKARVLFQNGDSFPRNAKTEFVVTGTTTTNETCECSGFFFIVCWFFKCLLGFLFN